MGSDIVSVISIVITVIIGIAAFWITYVTSTRASERSMALASTAKLAEFRMNWIESFREDLSKLHGLQLHYAQLVSKNYASTSLKNDATRDIRIEMSQIRRRLLLRLNPLSKDGNEIELEKMLLRATSQNSNKAASDRRRQIELGRLILKTEWDRVKTEMKIKED